MAGMCSGRDFNVCPLGTAVNIRTVISRAEFRQGLLRPEGASSLPKLLLQTSGNLRLAIGGNCIPLGPTTYIGNEPLR